MLLCNSGKVLECLGYPCKHGKLHQGLGYTVFMVLHWFWLYYSSLESINDCVNIFSYVIGCWLAYHKSLGSFITRNNE